MECIEREDVTLVWNWRPVTSLVERRNPLWLTSVIWAETRDLFWSPNDLARSRMTLGSLLNCSQRMTECSAIGSWYDMAMTGLTRVSLSVRMRMGVKK